MVLAHCQSVGGPNYGRAGKLRRRIGTKEGAALHKNVHILK